VRLHAVRVGLKGQARRAMVADVSTAGSEQRERPKGATSRASRRGWGFEVFTASSATYKQTATPEASLIIDRPSVAQFLPAALGEPLVAHSSTPRRRARRRSPA